jgi:hypothetical protein
VEPVVSDDYVEIEVELPESTIKFLERIAQETGRTFNEVCVDILRKQLNKEG